MLVYNKFVILGSYRSESLGILGVTSPPSKTSSLEHSSKF